MNVSVFLTFAVKIILLCHSSKIPIPNIYLIPKKQGQTDVSAQHLRYFYWANTSVRPYIILLSAPVGADRCVCPTFAVFLLGEHTGSPLHYSAFRARRGRPTCLPNILRHSYWANTPVRPYIIPFSAPVGADRCVCPTFCAISLGRTHRFAPTLFRFPRP